jgi:predicted GNAT family acetyltransferase
LRRATLADLPEVMAVNASMAVEECGVNPAERDPIGYRVRTARRIEQGRVWVWARDNRLVFKADALAETPGAVYLEGVHIHPEERGKGYGLRCMSQLARTLLRDADAVCLVANERSEAARKFYRKAGYRFVGRYDTIYLQPRGG